MCSATTQFIIASGNRHKVREIQAMVGSSYRCHSLSDLRDPPPLVEDGNTFQENAERKARQLAEWLAKVSPSAQSAIGIETGCLILADDSGLEVDFLNGAPGVLSARFAGELRDDGNAGDAQNNARLLHLLEGVPAEKRQARFRCVLALIQGKRGAEVAEAARFFEGVCEGRISEAPQGNQGFGYDPLFIPTGYDRSFAELGDSVKNQLSHRSRALAALRADLEKRTEAV